MINIKLLIIRSINYLINKLESIKIKLNSNKMTSDKVILIIETFFNINIKIKNRKIEIVKARQIAMYFIYYYSKKYKWELTLKNIGYLCGKKDHSTVLHSLKMVNNYIETEKDYREEIEEIKKLIES